MKQKRQAQYGILSGLKKWLCKQCVKLRQCPKESKSNGSLLEKYDIGSKEEGKAEVDIRRHGGMETWKQPCWSW